MCECLLSDCASAYCLHDDDKLFTLPQQRIAHLSYLSFAFALLSLQASENSLLLESLQTNITDTSESASQVTRVHLIRYRTESFSGVNQWLYVSFHHTTAVLS